MKDLLIFLNEEGIAATPGNTVGMGNPMPAGVNGEMGTEPLPTAKAKKEKRKYKISESIFDNNDIVNDANESIILEFIEQNYRITGRIRFESKFGRARRASNRIKQTEPTENDQIEIKNGIVNIKGNILCKNYNLISLTNGMFRFGTVTGNFDCSGCKKLKSLEGAPEEVKDFDCIECNSLKNLIGAPKNVTGNFHCSGCKKLKSLEGAPEEVSGVFDCSGCKSLESLKYGPKKVIGSYYCFDCSSLKSLEGMADGFRHWGVTISCANCESLESLKGMPETISGEFCCSQCNSLKSLEGAPKKCNDFDCSNCNDLKNLIGGPITTTGNYDCSNCKSLESLEGAPEEIKGDFYCAGCDKLSKSDILKVNARDIYYT